MERLAVNDVTSSLEVHSLTPLLTELQEGLFRYKWVQSPLPITERCSLLHAAGTNWCRAAPIQHLEAGREAWRRLEERSTRRSSTSNRRGRWVPLSKQNVFLVNIFRPITFAPDSEPNQWSHYLSPRLVSQLPLPTALPQPHKHPEKSPEVESREDKQPGRRSKSSILSLQISQSRLSPIKITCIALLVSKAGDQSFQPIKVRSKFSRSQIIGPQWLSLTFQECCHLTQSQSLKVVGTSNSKEVSKYSALPCPSIHPILSSAPHPVQKPDFQESQPIPRSPVVPLFPRTPANPGFFPSPPNFSETAGTVAGTIAHPCLCHVRWKIFQCDIISSTNLSSVAQSVTQRHSQLFT